MNNELWKKMLTFEFDNPLSEYCFSTRLANENNWTKSFTEQAIIEYKKFMYLAAITHLMVAPSETIDKVWHQHLIFTESYQEFCKLIGKQIQHIPSTHRSSEFANLKQAKDRTRLLYENNFGEQPKNIWHFQNMLDILNLNKANFNIRTIIIIGLIAFICLSVPAYFILQPLYTQIDNSIFVLSITLLSILTFILLQFYNKVALNKIIAQFDKTSFIYDLHPFELIYLKTKKLRNVKNGVVNELINSRDINVNNDQTIELTQNNPTKDKFHFQIVSVLNETGKTTYPNLLIHLNYKPIFLNIPNCMNAFKKHFKKSEKFGFVFYKNYIVLLILLLFAFTRLIADILREKSNWLTGIVTTILIVFIILFLKKLTAQIFDTIIPKLYKDDILPNTAMTTDWQWRYFVLGNAMFTGTFAKIANYKERKLNNNDNGSYDTTYESNCGNLHDSCSGCGGSD
jgi:hypothetical protein